MKILFLCNKSPYPAKEGGPIAMNNLIRSLADNGHQVKVVAVNSFKYNIKEQDIPDDIRRLFGLELIDLDLRVKPLPAFRNLFTQDSYHVERFISQAFGKRVVELLKEEDFDIVQLETLFMAPYVDLVRKYSKAKIVLRAHNIEHRIWQGISDNSPFFLKKLYVRHLAKTLRSFELKVLKQVDGIAAITKQDARYFGKYTKKPIISISFGVNPDKYPYNSAIMPRDIFHLGSMNWMPNQEGLQWFVEKVWPIIREKDAQVKCHFAGNEMPREFFGLNDERIIVKGRVEDAIQFFGEHGISIAPLLSGSGIRIKIIETMAMGRAVVSTSLGAEGINYTPGENILIADDSKAFAEAILNCLNNWEKTSEIGNKARKLIERDHNSQKIVDQLVHFYNEIL